MTPTPPRVYWECLIDNLILLVHSQGMDQIQARLLFNQQSQNGKDDICRFLDLFNAAKESQG